MTIGVEFRLLGRVEAYLGEQVIDLGPARQRCVAAVLLAEANHVVEPDRLIDRTWGEHAPYRARETLRTYLTRLRRALGEAAGVEIGRRSGGYVLEVDALAVDLHRFRALVTRARGDENALTLLEQASALWRGEAFADLDTPWLNALRDTVEAERIAVELDLTDLRLAKGRHHELLAELSERAAVRPLDERLAAQLLVALYRSARQADAIELYHRTRKRLNEALGADPGPQLQELYLQVLNADPALEAPVAGAAVPPPRVPRQLPRAPRLFTGRDDALAAVGEVAAEPHGAVVISAIGGTGGIGKTWLALQWAHQNLGRFPGGQLHADLRGFAPAAEPADPADVVRLFLEALGVESTAIPADRDSRFALYRSLMADRRMLVLLDNARSTEQVEQLLPGSAACTVLVTSRHQLNGLVVRHGARPVDLDVLTPAEARELFARHVGAERVAAEPDAVTALLHWCAGLPIALGIVAARSARHRSGGLTELAAELDEESARLDALDGGELSVNLRAVFTWSVDALPPESATAFALLGIAPGPDIGLAAAAALVGIPESRAGALLEALVEASLLQEHLPGRYRLHDLLRLFARERAERDLPAGQGDSALRRLVDFCVHTAFAGDHLLAPGRPRINVGTPVPGYEVAAFPDHVTALAWFDAEHATLLAAQSLAADRDWHSAVWRLASVMDTYHSRRGHSQARLAVWRLGLAAAKSGGNPDEIIQAHRLLGGTYAIAGRSAEAFEHLTSALEVADTTGNPLARADTHMALAVACEQQGDNERALEHASEALSLCRPLNQPFRTANLLNTVGWFSARLGRYDEAQTHCAAALALSRDYQDRGGEAHALHNLGYAAHHGGDPGLAVKYYGEAVELLRQLGHTYYEADGLDRLGQAHALLGQSDPARKAWNQALALYRAQHRPTEIDRIQEQLAGLVEKP